MCSCNRQFNLAAPWYYNCLSSASSICAIIQALQTVPVKDGGFMPLQKQLLVPKCAFAAAVSAMHHADWTGLRTMWIDTEAGGLPGCSRGGGHLSEGGHNVAAVAQQGPNRLHLPLQVGNALQARLGSLSLHSSSDAPQGMLCLVALLSRCPARHVMLNCSLQQMPCKADYIQLQSSADALQGTLFSFAVFCRCPARHTMFSRCLQQMGQG